MFYTTPVQLVTPARVDGRTARGILTWDPDKGATVEDIPFTCEFQPRTSDETTGSGNRVQSVSGFMLYTPPGCDLAVDRHSRFIIAGRVYEVVGEPAVWPGSYPSGVDHVEVELRRVAE